VAEVAVEAEEVEAEVVLALEEEAVVVELVAEVLVWVPESVRMLDRHKSMRRSLGRLLRRLLQVCGDSAHYCVIRNLQPLPQVFHS